MSAIVRACKSSTSFKNSGTGSNLFPQATAMIFVVSPKLKFTLADLNNPDIVSVFTEWIHADGDDRIYPLFGNQIPISGIANTKGTDNTVTLDNGTVMFVSYSQYIKLFSTTDGGLCFAKVLKSFNNAPMAVIEVDIAGNIICKGNSDGTYSGLKCTLFAPAIDMADLKNPAKSYFQLGYMPDYFVDNAVTLSDGKPLLDLIGLFDLSIQDTGTSTITSLRVKIIDDCCGDDVTAEYGQILADADDFEVTSPTGATVPVTSSTYDAVNNVVALAGTFNPTTTYKVGSAAPSQLFLDDAEGIEIAPGDVTVP
jgi:hypothetical protein